MRAHDFEFAVEVSGRPASQDMLRAVALQVLGQVGCAPEVAAMIAEDVEAAVANVNLPVAGPCRVQFSLRGGTLNVDVSSGARRIWQTSRAVA